MFTQRILIRTRVVALCTAWVAASLVSIHAARAESTDSLSSLLAARGKEYVAIRDSLVAKGQAALPALQARLTDPDWHVRLVARAVIGRIKHLDAYTRYERLSVVPIMSARTAHIVTPGTLAEKCGVSATERESDRNRLKHFFESDGVAFLVEVALKGSIISRPLAGVQLPAADPNTLYTMEEVADMLGVDEELATTWMAFKAFHEYPGEPLKIRHNDVKTFAGAFLGPSNRASESTYSQDARRWAIILLGDFCEDPAAVSTLAELIQSSEPQTIRAYAATALGLSNSASVIDSLTQATKDGDEQVAAAARSALQRVQTTLERMRKAEQSAE